MQCIEIIWLWLNSNFTGTIATFAFLAAAIQAYIAYRQNKNSVRPYLHARFTCSKEGNLILFLENAGLGPAMIDDYYIVYKETQYRDQQIFNLFSEVFPQAQLYFLRPGYAISKGDKLQILTHPADDIDSLQTKLHQDFELVIRYESFLGDKITYTSKTHRWPSNVKIS